MIGPGVPQHALGGPLGGGRRREVGVDHRGEVVLAHPQQQAVVGDAGVGDQHLDGADWASTALSAASTDSPR